MCDTVIKRVEAHWNVVSVSDTMYIVHGENDSLYIHEHNSYIYVLWYYYVNTL